MATALSELQRPLDIQDYLNSPEEGERFEIINGEMVVVPPPSTKHGWVVQALMFALGTVIRNQKLGVIYVAPVGVRLSENNILEPDLFFVSESQKSQLKERFFDGAPELVVEVLSLSSRRIDLIRKMAIYQRAGVREYWVADPADRSIRVFVLTDGKYLEQKNIDDVAVSTVIPGIAINVDGLFSEIW